jgi:small ligand-binding sensory domain FIST
LRRRGGGPGWGAVTALDGSRRARPPAALAHGPAGGRPRRATSELPDSDAAAEEVAGVVREALGGAPDAAFLVCSEAYGPGIALLSERLRAALGGGVLVGCTARSVIGGGAEIEDRPALSLTAAMLPRVTVRPLRVAGEGFPHGAEAWCEAFDIDPAARPHFVLLADPWTCDAEAFVQQLDRDFPGAVSVGGLASGAERPGENALLLEHRIHAEGLVGVALWGDVVVDGVVAQGCRPIGHPMFVTRAREHLLTELDGRPPMELLRALYDASCPRDQALMQTSLFLGIEMRPELHEYRQGDFLIRNLVGADPEDGALAVAAPLRDGLVVQFHLRDATTSAADLEDRLARYRRAPGPGGDPAGALLFSCLGRGTGFYGRPDHDSDAFRRHLGPLPLGGFFCNGEIGPVGQRSFLHGYTSAFGIFRPLSSI